MFTNNFYIISLRNELIFGNKVANINLQVLVVELDVELGHPHHAHREAVRVRAVGVLLVRRVHPLDRVEHFPVSRLVVEFGEVAGRVGDGHGEDEAFV